MSECCCDSTKYNASQVIIRLREEHGVLERKYRNTVASFVLISLARQKMLPDIECHLEMYFNEFYMLSVYFLSRGHRFQCRHYIICEFYHHRITGHFTGVDECQLIIIVIIFHSL